MKLEEIIPTSHKVLNNTYSLYTKSDSNSINARFKEKKCMEILKELNSVIKLLVKYLLRDFDFEKP